MLFNSIKEISRLRREINRSLRDVFNSIKEINKKRNKLSSKGMSNIYFKNSIDAFSKLRFSGIKKICHQVSF